MVDALGFGGAGDGVRRRRVTQGLGIVPEPREAQADVVVTPDGSNQVPSSLDDGSIEVLLRDIDAHVEGVVEGWLRGSGPHRLSVRSTRRRRRGFPYRFLPPRFWEGKG